MSATGEGSPTPAGVRCTPGGPLVYVDAGRLTLAVGEWVVVADPLGERIGEVVIAPSQILESVLTGPLPRVARRARPEERPAPSSGAGGASLLRSLELPAWAAEPPAVAGGSPPPDEQRSREQDQRQHAGED